MYKKPNTRFHVRICRQKSGIQYNDQSKQLKISADRNQECVQCERPHSSLKPNTQQHLWFTFTQFAEMHKLYLSLLLKCNTAVVSTSIIFSVLLFTVCISLCIIYLGFVYLEKQPSAVLLSLTLLLPSLLSITTGCTVHRWDVTSAQTHSIKL